MMTNRFTVQESVDFMIDTSSPQQVETSGDSGINSSRSRFSFALDSPPGRSGCDPDRHAQRFSFVNRVVTAVAEEMTELPGVSDLVSNQCQISVFSDDPTHNRLATNMEVKMKVWSAPVYDVDPEEEKRVIEMRNKQLLGKTVIGYLQLTGSNYKKYWIRWNSKKCDNIYIHEDLVKKVLGPEPQKGTPLKATITELGPAHTTAWRMHPQCVEIEPASRSEHIRFNAAVRRLEATTPTEQPPADLNRRSVSPSCRPCFIRQIEGLTPMMAADSNRLNRSNVKPRTKLDRRASKAMMWRRN